MKPEKTKRKSRGDDYVNNKEFSAAVLEYTEHVAEDISNGKEPRQIPNYIGECFIKIANGLSRSPNFMNYSYREDMVMDAVENCVKAIANYDITKPTRTGNPNAFSYFTQISWYAFLRRIAKEKKQADIKLSLIEKGGIGNFAEFGEGDASNGESLVEKIRQKNDSFYNDRKATGPDNEDTKHAKKMRAEKRVVVGIEDHGPLSDFLIIEESA
jgi:hypothetical protein